MEKLDANARSKSQSKCAACVREALEAGGIDTRGHPVPARKYGSFLANKGFETVNQDGYSALKRDIVVMQPAVGGNPAGHIQMYNSHQWVSDFRQRGF